MINNDLVSVEKYQAIFHRTGWSFADFYVTYAQTHQADFAGLDQELANLLTVRTWLTNQSSDQSAHLLIALIKTLTTFLQRPEFATELLRFCQSGWQACQRLETNSGWVLLLRYEAHIFLGEWDEALKNAQAAIKVTQNTDPANHAKAMLALGRLQFNRGDYPVALNTLAQAQSLLMEAQDIEGAATAQAEVAAYYLNRGELDKALSLYLEVDKLRRQINPTDPSNHSLLMLGVVYRKKQEYQKATAYLLELLRRSEAHDNRVAIATASHHLAWVYLDQRNMSEAYCLATRARQLYLEINDPRGVSDSDEQLGMIALISEDFEAAETFLKRSLTVRQQLGNQQGAASSLRNLSILYVCKGNVWLGLRYLWHSCAIYWRLGVLSRWRILVMTRQFWRLAVVERRH